MQEPSPWWYGALSLSVETCTSTHSPRLQRYHGMQYFCYNLFSYFKHKTKKKRNEYIVVR